MKRLILAAAVATTLLVVPTTASALNVYAAFQRAKDQVRKDAQPWIDINAEVGALDRDARKALTRDVMTYGLKEARKVLDTVTQYVQEQGLVNRRIGLEEIFAPNTMDL